jgi:hypothetical protein
VRILIATLLALTAAAPASAATSSDIVGFLNQQRAANQIPASVAFDSYRTTGCRNHNHYMTLNGLRQGENVGDPGYTPEGADYSGSGEVLAQGGVGWSATSNPWDTAPLHQTLLFDPRVNTAGADESEGFSCVRLGFDFAQAPSPALYAFTGDAGRTDVPFSVTVRGEGPYAPQEQVGIRQGVATGPNILFFAQGFGSSDRAVAYSLVGPAGPVEVKMVDSTTPAPGGGPSPFSLGGDLIPVKPLEPLADYEAAVTWENDGGARLDQKVAFRTAGRLVQLKLSLGRKLSRSRRATLAAPAHAVGQPARVKIAVARRGKSSGTVSTRNITLKRKQTIRAPRPPAGGSVVITVTVATFVAGDAKYVVARTSRRYR